jgi:hypothetical protein
MSRPPSSREPNDVADEFLALNQYLGAGGDRAGALQRLVALATQLVTGCDWAAVTEWPAARPPRSHAVSGDTARAVDQLQYELGDGPCLVAAADSEVVRVPDLVADTRWPAFAEAAVTQTPARGVLSFHLADRPQRAALNLYSGTAGAFDDSAVNVAALFAAHARVLLLHAASSDKVANLEQALSTSRQIGAAVGILMNAYKITDEQAFALLRTTSQHLNRKLRDVAVDVTETGALPDA